MTCVGVKSGPVGGGRVASAAGEQATKRRASERRGRIDMATDTRLKADFRPSPHASASTRAPSRPGVLPRTCHTLPKLALLRGHPPFENVLHGGLMRTFLVAAGFPASSLVALAMAIGCGDSGSSPPVDAAAATAADGGAGGAGVACGALTCDTTCCISSTGATACAAMCVAPYTTFELTCDGPEDCEGKACCGSLSAGVACTTTAHCATGAEFCHTKADCGAGQCCVPSTVAGVPHDVCAATPGC